MYFGAQATYNTIMIVRYQVKFKISSRIVIVIFILH